MVKVFRIAMVGFLTSCGVQESEHDRTLKAVFEDDFYIGTAVSSGHLQTPDPAADSVIWQQFNALTPENVMKAEEVQPEWGRFDFRAADRFVAYGERYRMHMVGHALIWHSQLPVFVHRISSADSMRLFMAEHIATVAGRYADRIHAWDVVNEALNEDGTLRESVFHRLLGDDYLIDAFRLAQIAAPQAELYYNDYNIEQPAKRAGCIALIRSLQTAGVRIDGVGIQGHWKIGEVPFDDIEQSILEYAALGVKVMITELDIEVLPRDFEGAEIDVRTDAVGPESNPYVDGFPAHAERQQADDYERLFRLFLKHRDKISRITFWGINDGYSWLNDWPIPGRTNYPLLFDRGSRPKTAFYRVCDIREHQQ